MDCPINTRRSSCSEWRGSTIVIDNGSPNAVLASSKETPCFPIFAEAFLRSHSNKSAIGCQIPSFSGAVIIDAEADHAAFDRRT